MFLELSVNQLWCSGPELLKADITPKEEADTGNMPEECATEMRVKNHNLLVSSSKAT